MVKMYLWLHTNGKLMQLHKPITNKTSKWGCTGSKQCRCFIWIGSTEIVHKLNTYLHQLLLYLQLRHQNQETWWWTTLTSLECSSVGILHATMVVPRSKATSLRSVHHSAHAGLASTGNPSVVQTAEWQTCTKEMTTSSGLSRLVRLEWVNHRIWLHQLPSRTHSVNLYMFPLFPSVTLWWCGQMNFCDFTHSDSI